MWGKAMIVFGALISLMALIGWGIEPLEEPMDTTRAITPRTTETIGSGRVRSRSRPPTSSPRSRPRRWWWMSDLAHDAAVAHHDEHESTGIENRKLGMWVFLSSEFLFFGALITNYLLYSNRVGSKAPTPPRSTTSPSPRSARSSC
jgi:hypothetical protein